MGKSVLVLPIEAIVSDPNIRAGRPIIAGTTLTVQDIAAAHSYRGRSVTELAEDYDLTLTDVHAALAYYYAHQAEIDAAIQSDLEFARQAKEKGLGQRHSPLL